MIPFDLENTAGKPGGSELLDRILSRLQNTIGSLARSVTNDRLIPVTFTVATTDVTVRHGLNAPVKTWEIVDRNANAVVWRSATVNPNLRDTMIFQASAAVTVLVRFT